MTDMRPSETTAEEFEALLDPILGAAYGTAIHMTRNREEAEDMVQEAAVLAFRAFHTFEPGTNFKAWFFRILVNRIRNEYRKRQRAPETFVLDDAPDLYLYLQTTHTGIKASHANPAALIISKLSEEQIRSAIGALPDEYRLAAVLYFLEEASYQDIAEMLDCPVGTVRSRLHRGRKLLQKALWQIAGEHGVVNALSVEREALV
jgi:RNA polymerase sigma-70 factor, ECF subfamily